MLRRQTLLLLGFTTLLLAITACGEELTASKDATAITANTDTAEQLAAPGDSNNSATGEQSVTSPNTAVSPGESVDAPASNSPTTDPAPSFGDMQMDTPGDAEVDPSADTGETGPLYLTEAWSDVWLCDENSVAVHDITADADLNCSLSVEVDDDTLVITATGIPNHDFESTIGCCAAEIDNRWVIPLEPQPDTDGELTMAPERGPVAFTVSGVAIYGPEEGPGGDAVALEYGYFEEDRQPIDLGVCGGHAGPGGQYHYHYDGNCLHWHPGEGEDIVNDYAPADTQATGEANLIGFAFDGYPIYGSYEEDADGELVEVFSSYRLIDGANGYGGIDDYEYVQGLGDLDECNGHFGPTPQVPEGMYHYHTTLTNGEGDLGFPYFPLCYHGEVEDENMQFNDLGGAGLLPQGFAPNGPPPPRR